MLWVDEKELDGLVQALHAAARHCRNVEDLLVMSPSDPRRLKTLALGVLSIVMEAPVVEQGRQFVAMTGPRDADDPVRVATWPPLV